MATNPTPKEDAQLAACRVARGGADLMVFVTQDAPVAKVDEAIADIRNMLQVLIGYAHDLRSGGRP